MLIPPSDGPARSAYAVDAPVKPSRTIGGPGGEEQRVHRLTCDAIAELKRVEAVNDDCLAIGVQQRPQKLRRSGIVHIDTSVAGVSDQELVAVGPEVRWRH